MAPPLCTSDMPGETGGHYVTPYVEAVEGYRHAYQVPAKPPARAVRWTRDPNHPPDPKCPECAASK